MKNPTALDEHLPKSPQGVRLWTWLILCNDGKRTRCGPIPVRAECHC